MRTGILFLVLCIAYSSNGQTLQETRVIIGKAYFKGVTNFKRNEVQVINELQHEVKDIEIFYRGNLVAKIDKLSAATKRTVKFKKSKGDTVNTITIKTLNITDSVQRTDFVSFNIHELKIFRDRFSIIPFKESTLEMTPAATEELQYIANLVAAAKDSVPLEIVLEGISSEHEYRTDGTIGLRRAKAAIDTLVKQWNVSPNKFLIRDEVPKTNSRIGVHYQIVTPCICEEVSPADEDIYFQQFTKKIKRKKG
ncbi:MAG TPA: hypothetical protein VIU12_32155 [Chryseolinea sp.]